MQVMFGHLRRAFLTRLLEWFFAIMLFQWGVVLLMPDATFERAAFAAFSRWDENWVGAAFMLGGMIRLGVLFANGAWRPMYYLRAWMAESSLVIWLAIALGFASSAGLGVWIAVYPAAVIFEAVNVFRALGDAADAEREARALPAPRNQGAGTHVPHPG